MRAGRLRCIGLKLQFLPTHGFGDIAAPVPAADDNGVEVAVMEHGVAAAVVFGEPVGTGAPFRVRWVQSSNRGLRFERSGLIETGVFAMRRFSLSDDGRPLERHRPSCGPRQALLTLVVGERDLEPLNRGRSPAGHNVQLRHRGILSTSPHQAATAPQTTPDTEPAPENYLRTPLY
jgi:hypothetical protein